MSQIRMGCIQTGTSLGVVGGAIPSLGLADSLTGGNYKKPTAISGLPRISDALDYKNSTVDTTGLTNPSAYEWRIVDGATISTAASIQREFTLGTTLDQLSETSVTLSETIPAGTPASGHIIIYRNAGAAEPVSRLAYSSWTGSTFTLTTATRFSNSSGDTVIREADAGNFVGIVQHSGQWIECRVTADPASTVYTSPPIMVYATAHMGMFDAGHNVDDEAMVANAPHKEVTHYAVADGNWTNPAIWNTGTVPKNGAFPLITRGRDVVYDNEEVNVRLDRVRVDGTLRVDTASLTDEAIEMLVETICVTRGGTFTIGTSNATRVPDTASVRITFSGKDYSADSFTMTDLKSSNFLATRGWGRGLISHGTVRMWGAKKTPWLFADAPVAQGATSLTLTESPVGWEVGDQIIISATSSDYDGPGTTLGGEDEYRVLTSVSGATLSWETPLVYPHDNQSAVSTRTDIAPIVARIRGKNITLRTEPGAEGGPGNAYRRGHFAAMHHMAKSDIWDVEFIEMGRTDKSIPSGVINSSNQFKYYTDTAPAGGYTETLTPRSNLQARYSVHKHMMGFNLAEVPTANGCFVDGTFGWGMVHHSCQAKLDNNVIHRFWGAGMVSEAADEIDSWEGNLAIHGIHPNDDPNRDFNSNIKSLETNMGILGDTFRWNYGFAFRGRAMRTNRNWAVSCNSGHVFFHRDNPFSPDAFSQPKGLRRDVLDLQELGAIRLSNDANTLGFEKYPIVHFNGNGALACKSGGYISKPGPQQDHDASIRLRNFKAYGCNSGFGVEYIGNYVLEGFDCVGPSPASASRSGPDQGIFLGGNVFQMAIINSRLDGFNQGIFWEGLDSGGTYHDQFTQDDPRYMQVGVDLVNCTTPVVFGTGYTKTVAEVTYTDEDWDGTAIDIDLDPSDTFPLTIADYDNGTAFSDNPPSNADGKKVDNLGNQGNLLKYWAETALPSNTSQIFGYASRTNNPLYGYHQYSGVNKIVWEDVLSDRLTGRPTLKTRMVNALATSGLTDRGTFTYSTTPVVRDNILATVAKDGTVVIDPVTGATGGGGAGTYFLKTKMSSKPDHGEAVLDGSAGTITYEPAQGYTGADEMTVFVGSQGQYATVRVSILIGSTGSGLTTPAVTTHFTAADGGSQSIDVTLNAPPDADKRQIILTQYSTDEGFSWRRLAQGWPPCVVNITKESDGTDITAGSYNLRIRYKTNHEYGFSTASGDAAVTVS